MEIRQLFNVKKYKRSIISVFIIIGALIFMLSVGFTIGFLSNDPDGLERVLIDQNGESWLENLVSPRMSSAFYLIIYYKKKNSINIAQ